MHKCLNSYFQVQFRDWLFMIILDGFSHRVRSEYVNIRHSKLREATVGSVKRDHCFCKVFIKNCIWIAFVRHYSYLVTQGSTDDEKRRKMERSGMKRMGNMDCDVK